MSLLKGVIPVIPTPFSKDGETVEIDIFQRLVEYGIQEGADGVCLFAAGAEFYKLTREEKNLLFKAAVEVNQKRLPILVTVSEHATLLAQREASYYEEHGADAVNIMPPSFAAPSEAMIAGHVMEICKSISVPAVLQYAPALTGRSISLDTFRRITGAGLLPELYIKLEASPTGPMITVLRKELGERCHIVVGNSGECMYEALARGACAVMPGLSMVKKFKEIYDAYETGRAEASSTHYRKLLPFIHFMVRDIEQFAAMEKIVLMDQGLCSNAVCRAPSNEPDEWTVGMLRELVHPLITHE